MRAGNGLLWIYLYFVARVSGSAVWVKKIPPCTAVFLHFSQTVGNFFNQFLQTYCTFLSTLDYKFLFSYLQFWRNYAILSTTT